MLTHVHKVIHLVVGTFEQGLETSPAPYTEKTGVHRMTGRWWCNDQMLGSESGQWQQKAHCLGLVTERWSVNWSDAHGLSPVSADVRWREAHRGNVEWPDAGCVRSSVMKCRVRNLTRNDRTLRSSVRSLSNWCVRSSLDRWDQVISVWSRGHVAKI